MGDPIRTIEEVVSLLNISKNSWSAYINRAKNDGLEDCDYKVDGVTTFKDEQELRYFWANIRHRKGAIWGKPYAAKVLGITTEDMDVRLRKAKQLNPGELVPALRTYKTQNAEFRKAYYWTCVEDLVQWWIRTNDLLEPTEDEGLVLPFPERKEGLRPESSKPKEKSAPSSGPAMRVSYNAFCFFWKLETGSDYPVSFTDFAKNAYEAGIREQRRRLSGAVEESLIDKNVDESQ